jgi:hypothetical protein
MIASKKQITAIQKLTSTTEPKNRLLSIFALKDKLKATKKITLVSSNAEQSSTWIDLTFACTKLGLCRLNSVVNATMRGIQLDDSITVYKTSHSVYFEIPDNFNSKDAGVLYKCMCVRIIIRTGNVSSRSKALNLFLANSACFI